MRLAGFGFGRAAHVARSPTVIHTGARGHDTCSTEGRIKMTQCEYIGIGGGEERGERGAGGRAAG